MSRSRGLPLSPDDGLYHRLREVAPVQVDHAQKTYWDEYYRCLGERGFDLDWGGRWTDPFLPLLRAAGARDNRPTKRVPGECLLHRGAGPGRDSPRP